MTNPMLKRLTNHSEHRVYEQVAKACDEFGAEVYRKIRIADVIDIDQCAERSQGTYALMAHFDFVICDENHMPQFVIEFDGAGHDPKNDHKKDGLCREADLAIFRVDFLALDKALEEMSFLRYLVHVWFMGHEFERARRDGRIPIDEPFMMWGFLKKDARDIFDSEYNFMREAQIALERLNRKHGFAKIPIPSSAISHYSLRHDDGRFAAFACIEARDMAIFGRHEMKLAVPCYGSLGDVPFGPTALADFNDGFAYRNLVENVELYLAGGAHTLTRDADIAADIAALKAGGFAMLHGGGMNGNPLNAIMDAR